MSVTPVLSWKIADLSHRTAKEGYRVLILAPFGRDAETASSLLKQNGYDVAVCSDLAAVASSISEKVGVVLATEEGLAGDAAILHEALRRQPDWSDVPFILLAAQRTTRPGPVAEAARMRLLNLVPNAIVVERPVGLPSLLSATASAMRSRQRQFDMRDRLKELETSREALLASETELRLIADALPTLIGFVDRSLHYRFANKAYETWFGVSPADAIGRSVRDMHGETGFASRQEQMDRALSGETVRWEMSWPHLDGSRRDAEIRYIPRRDDHGNVDGFHVFVLDITERKQVEEDLEQRVVERTEALTREMANRESAESALRQSQKMEAVGQLTGGIAHDFNNMLTGVLGALSIIQRRIEAGKLDDVNRFIEAASTSAHRAAALTARLLSFSRRQSLDAKPHDTSTLLASLEDLLRRSIRENIRLNIVGAEGLPPALVDANQLENAILNLVINARDAMPDGGDITIENRTVEIDATAKEGSQGLAPGQYVVVSVTDTGVGMPPELLEKVFDPFFTTKPMGQGTGLGLSMIYGFAKQSNGQVRIHSQPGVGTKVSIYLPASKAVEDDSAAATSELLEGSGEVVLLVEDDPAVRLLIGEILSDLSYQWLEAEEANAAITILRSDERIDLMVSDVGLPGMNGRQLAEVARQHRPDLPILFVTGYAENAAIRAGFLGTNMDMISKPFVMEELANKISKMMASKRTKD